MTNINKKDYETFATKLNSAMHKFDGYKGWEIVNFQIDGFSNNQVVRFLKKYKRDKEIFSSVRMTVEFAAIFKA